MDSEIVEAMHGVYAMEEKESPPPKEVIERAVRRLHEALSHPSRADLLRVLQHGGASEEAMQVGRTFVCATCGEQGGAKPEARMNMPRDILPLVEVAIDCKEIPGWQKKDNGAIEKRKILSILDLGSHFFLAILLPKLTDPTATELLQVYHERWTSVFGMPVKVHTDPAGAHISHEAMTALGADASEAKTTAGEAHWQNAAAERAGQEFENRLQKVLSARPPSSEAEYLLVFYEVLRSRNMMVHQHGYSAYQHLLGRQPRLPTDVLDRDLDVTALSAALAEAGPGYAAAVRHQAKVAWLQLADYEAMRQVVDQRPRDSRSSSPVTRSATGEPAAEAGRRSPDGPDARAGTEERSW